MRRVCVFCGSRLGTQTAYSEVARELGRLLGDAGCELVYGGGRLGLMGLVADAAVAAGARVIGVIPEFMIPKEVAHTGLAELRVVPNMHERKALMAELADAFVTLPGGLGTLDELTEILSWAQLGLHSKPVGLVNVDGFFDSYLEMLDHATARGFMRREHRDLVAVDVSPASLLDRLANVMPSAPNKWVGLERS